MHGVCAEAGDTGCIPAWPFVVLGGLWASLYLLVGPIVLYTYSKRPAKW